MKKTKRFTAILLVAVLLGGCGNSGVSQEEYDRVVAERNELKESFSNEENPARDFFEEIEGVTVSESGDSRRKSLVLTCYAKLYTDNDAMSDTAESIGEKLRDAQKEDWFDYDYILLDFWSESVGRIVSFTISPNDLSKPIQMKEWYGEDNQNQQNSGSIGENYNDKETSRPSDSENIIGSNLEVTGEYFYIRGGDRARYFLVVKNTSGETVSVDASVIAKDGAGNILGAENESTNAISPNQEMVMGFYFDDAGAAENFEYTLNAEESKYAESYITDITCEVSINKNKLIILITNNGEEDIDHVMPYALFFNDGEIFSHEYSTSVEVKAGSTVPVELECFDGEFEDFQLYVSAWGLK